MVRSKVSVWINRKFLEWQLSQDRAANQAEFAEYLGVSPSTLSLWINDVQPPGKYSADLIASKLGPEIYELLEIEQREMIQLDNLPELVKDRLKSAIQEVNSELGSRGLSGDSPESEEIVTKIFEKYGFKYTNITRPDS